MKIWDWLIDVRSGCVLKMKMIDVRSGCVLKMKMKMEMKQWTDMKMHENKWKKWKREDGIEIAEEIHTKH